MTDRSPLPSPGDGILLQLEYPGFCLDADLRLPATGVAALFGVSGSGKTTVLRCLAGLEPRVRGRIRIQGDTWLDTAAGIDLPPQERALGYVFQDGRLFPHMSVRRNLDYGRRRCNGRAPVADFAAVVALLGLENLLERRPAELSGGEQQRVAIGRALLGAPRLLLLDEPLANLDRARKQEILPFLDRLAAELSIPMLYVSHSLGEVVRLCDHMVVLRRGGVLLQGPLEQSLREYSLQHEEGESHASVALQAEVADFDAGNNLTTLRINEETLRVPGRLGDRGRRIRVRIFADDVSLVSERPRASSVLNILPARVHAVHDHTPGQALVELDTPAGRLLSRISRLSLEALSLAPGLGLHAQIKGVAIRYGQSR